MAAQYRIGVVRPGFMLVVAAACGRIGFNPAATADTATPSDTGNFGEGTDVTCTMAGSAVLLALGRAHTCATTAAGLWCWGDNTSGQLGVGDTIERDLPAAVAGLPLAVAASAPTALSAHGDHTCSLSASSTLACWGLNADGELGTGDTMNRTTPSTVAGSWTQVATGGHHTCALFNGQLSCWGLNANGQLGVGDTASRSAPTLLAGSAWSDVAAGAEHTCGIQGPVPQIAYCWGANAHRQAGGSDTLDQELPRATGAPNALTFASSLGDFYTLGIRPISALFEWGANDRGELGFGDTMDRAPALLGASPMFIDATGGAAHTCAIDIANHLLCWGANDRGQLGLGGGATPNQLTPQQVGSDADWTAVVAGGSSTCAIKQDGRLFCWGANERGQLGLGHAFDRDHPVQVCLP